MTQKKILDIFKKTEALLTGHFLLTSGLHSNEYFQCAKVLQHPDIAEELCSRIVNYFSKKKITAVIAPAIGGIVVAHEVARFFGARALFTERENQQMVLRRGFEIKQGESVLVVEDVITTGGSVSEVINLVKKLEGIPVGLATIVDRSGGTIDFGLEYFSLISIDVNDVPYDKCNLCKRGVPIEKPGSRKILSDK